MKNAHPHRNNNNNGRRCCRAVTAAAAATEIDARKGERGSAIIIAVMIMGLLAIFVAVAVGRAATEATVMGNDAMQTRTFYTAQASLEMMTRNFSKIFETRVEPSTADLNNVRDSEPLGFDDFDINQTVTRTGALQTVTLSDDKFNGLKALQDEWTLTTTATSRSGVQVSLTRSFFNNRIPLFQFGVFYQNDMDLWPGPAMYIGGRAHTNGNLFMCTNDGLFFEDKVSASGEIVVNRSRNGGPTYYANKASVTDGKGGNPLVTEGSAINGPDFTGTDPEMPNGTKNNNWDAFKTRFNGNLVARSPKLLTPLQIDRKEDPVQIIKRGSSGEAAVLAAARYYNKASIRVTLDDSKDRLPNCSGVAGPCGIRLDGDANGAGGAPSDPNNTRGYQPAAMVGSPSYQATRVNGHRFYTGSSYESGGAQRQTWIKVELVTPNVNDPSNPTIQDVTNDFLSLGVTKPATIGGRSVGDSRSIIQLQQFSVPGPPLRVANVHITVGNGTITPTLRNDARPSSQHPRFSNSEDAVEAAFDNSCYDSNLNDLNCFKVAGQPTPLARVYTPVGAGATAYNVVTNYNSYVNRGEIQHQFPRDTDPAGKYVTINGHKRKIIPFPIKMYDVREGLYNHDLTDTDWNNLYQNVSYGVTSNGNLPARGIVSLVDIDVANLGRFLNGDFNSNFPSGLRNTDVPKDDRGYILYVSDRRGDRDNDGVYDMENIYVAAAGDTTGKQYGEDVGGGGLANLFPDNILQTDYAWESTTYSTRVEADLAAVTDHQYFRRAVRLVNGQQLPGNATTGLTLSTENGAYILGNFNATGAGAPDPVTKRPSPPSTYTGTPVPASVVADAVTILSNNWKDGKSFRTPFDLNTNLGLDIARKATETTVRAALLMGITKHSIISSPNQGGAGGGPAGGSQENLDGGVNNFPRLLEDWIGVDLNYCGSMVSLFYSRGHNGSFKGRNAASTEVKTFYAPTRNWTFDTNFLTPTQLPPGSPFLHYIQLTGFRQAND